MSRLLDFLFQAIDVWMASSIVFVFLSLIEFALVSLKCKCYDAVILWIKIYFRLISFWTVPRRRSSLAARIDSAGNR